MNKPQEEQIKKLKKISNNYLQTKQIGPMGQSRPLRTKSKSNLNVIFHQQQYLERKEKMLELFDSKDSFDIESSK